MPSAVSRRSKLWSPSWSPSGDCDRLPKLLADPHDRQRALAMLDKAVAAVELTTVRGNAEGRSREGCAGSEARRGLAAVTPTAHRRGSQRPLNHRSWVCYASEERRQNHGYSDCLTNVIFDEIQPGASASLTRTLSQTDIEVLALVSGDVDPFSVGNGRGAAERADPQTTTEAAGCRGAHRRRARDPPARAWNEDRSRRPPVPRQDRGGRQTDGDGDGQGKASRRSRSCLRAAAASTRPGRNLVTGTVTVAAPTRRVAYAEVVPAGT